MTLRTATAASGAYSQGVLNADNSKSQLPRGAFLALNEIERYLSN